MTHKMISQKRYIILVFALLFFYLGCWEFLIVGQQDLADQNSSFDVPITLSLTPEGDGGTPYFGILLPIGWTAKDSISYSGAHGGTFIHSLWASAEMDSFSRAPAGYYWWVCEGDSVDSLHGGTLSFTPRIYTDSQTGTFFLDYMITDRFEYGWRNSAYVVRSGPYPISVDAPMTVMVTNTNDNGPGSLRQAIKDVSSSGTILCNLSHPTPIVLDSHLVIDRNITITGPASELLAISGNDTARIFYIKENLKHVTMSNLHISHGKESEGGGIYCIGSNLRLDDVIIEKNRADNGGGIWCGSCYPGSGSG